MLIRSQDKESLINLNNITSIFIDKKYKDDVWYVQCDGGHMGEYSAKEKAIKVLDMIQEAYQGHLIDFYGNPVPEKIFTMPEDEEMEG